MIYEIRIRVDEAGHPTWQHDAAAEIALNPEQRWTTQALHEAYHSVQAALRMEAEIKQSNPRMKRYEIMKGA